MKKLREIRADNRARSEIRIRLSKRDLDRLDHVCRAWKVSRSAVFRALLKRMLERELEFTPEDDFAAAVEAMTGK